MSIHPAHAEAILTSIRSRMSRSGVPIVRRYAVPFCATCERFEGRTRDCTRTDCGLADRHHAAADAAAAPVPSFGKAQDISERRNAA